MYGHEFDRWFAGFCNDLSLLKKHQLVQVQGAVNASITSGRPKIPIGEQPLVQRLLKKSARRAFRIRKRLMRSGKRKQIDDVSAEKIVLYVMRKESIPSQFKEPLQSWIRRGGNSGKKFGARPSALISWKDLQKNT